MKLFNKHKDEAAVAAEMSPSLDISLDDEKKTIDVEKIIGLAVLAALLIFFICKPKFYLSRVGTDYRLMKKHTLGVILLIGIGVWILFKKPVSKKNDRKVSLISSIMSIPLCFLIIEYITNSTVANVLGMEPLFILINFVLLGAIYMIFLWISNSLKIAPVLLMVSMTLFAIINYFVYVFRGIPVMASDLLTISTAMDVAGDYTFNIRFPMYMAVLTMVLYVLWMLRLKETKLFKLKGRLIMTGVTIVTAVVVVEGVVLSSLLANMGVKIRMFRPMDTYRKCGCAVTFARSINYARVEKPEGYSLDAVKDIVKDYESDKAVKAENPTNTTPNVITIIDEAFSDISVLGDFKTDKEVLPNLYSLKENTVRGWTYASIYGGGTANSEFEFLTGNTMAFLPNQTVAFQMFVNKPMGALPSQLDSEGYDGIKALHPFTANNYSRPKVYPNLGFKQFLSKEDMPEDCEYVRGRISDEDSFKKIISEYEEDRKTSQKPFYMYNMTIQNHSPYYRDSFDASKSSGTEKNIEEIHIKDYNSDPTEIYLSMAHETDKAFKNLVDYFKKIDEPTVIAFFGDHQPRIESEFLSDITDGKYDGWTDEEMMRRYKVPFIIWANYDIQEQEVPATSMNFIQSKMLEATSGSMTGYQKFLIDFQKQVPSISANGYYGADGKYYVVGDKKSPYYDIVRKYAILQYNNVIDTKNRVDDFFNLKK